MNLILSGPAQADLEKYYNHIMGFNPAAAQEWYGKIIARCEALTLKPREGRSCEDAPEYQKIVEGQYFIYFTVGANAVEIKRVINSKQDQSRALREEPR